MKKSMFSIFSILLATFAVAQTPYTSSKGTNAGDPVILNGILSKYALQNEASFTWYQSNKNGYTPDSSLVSKLEAAKGKYQFVIFGGTWCEDTQNILPKFFKWQEQSGFSDDAISFFGVNRAKKTLGNFADVFKVINVPTIIVLKDGVEVGRVVEYGKTGKWDQEIADLLK